MWSLTKDSIMQEKVKPKKKQKNLYKAKKSRAPVRTGEHLDQLMDNVKAMGPDPVNTYEPPKLYVEFNKDGYIDRQKLKTRTNAKGVAGPAHKLRTEFETLE